VSRRLGLRQAAEGLVDAGAGNQPRYSPIATASLSRLRQSRSEISSVLKKSTTLSARALSQASPTEPTEARTR
jgi:hypothetical protein